MMEEDISGEVEVYSTKNQIEEFKESILWSDICRELDVWTGGFQTELDGMVDNIACLNPSTASVLTHLGDLNGRKKAVMYFKGILDVFLNILEEKANDTRCDKAD
jgi:hypothetical protein